MTFEGEEQISTDAAVETSSESPQSAPNTPPAKAEGQTQSDTQENVPFHKHPRWVERENELKSERDARQALEKRYQDLDNRFKQFSEQPKASPQADKRAAMIERLKGIDPEFAEFVEGLAPSQSIEEMKAQAAQQANESIKRQAYDTIGKLHAENKVPAELQTRYQRDIEAAIRANPNSRLEDLPSIYKTVHEDYTKFLDGVKRAERESYTTAKKADAKAPAGQPRGTPAATGQPEWAKNPEDRRAQLIQRVLKQSKASDSL